MPMLPPGPELAARNRRILAERLNWPDGALDACERLDRPGWSANYRREGCGPAGFYGTHKCARGPEVEVYGPTADDLDAAIAGHRCPPDVPWLPVR